MGKLELIEGKQTEWMGLWWHPEYNGFSSQSISLAELRKFKGQVRLYVRKNKYYVKGGNRPNYHFTLKDSNAKVFHLAEIEESEEDIYREEEGNRLYTEEEVYQVIHGMQREYGLSYGNDLISDYVY